MSSSKKTEEYEYQKTLQRCGALWMDIHYIYVSLDGHTLYICKFGWTYIIYMYVSMSVYVGLDSVLQCVAVCCSVLQCVAVCCSVLMCVSIQRDILDIEYQYPKTLQQCVAVCCSVLQCVVVCWCVSLSNETFLTYTSTHRDSRTPISKDTATVCGSVLQRVAVCCSVLQCVDVCLHPKRLKNTTIQRHCNSACVVRCSVLMCNSVCVKNTCVCLCVCHKRDSKIRLSKDTATV